MPARGLAAPIAVGGSVGVGCRVALACGVSLDAQAMADRRCPGADRRHPALTGYLGPDPINRRRLRWASSTPGAVLVAIAVIVGLVVGSGQTSIRAGGAAVSRPGPALGRYTLIYTGKHGVEVVPLDGQRHRVPLRTEAGPPVQTSAGVAFVRGCQVPAYLLTPLDDAPPRPPSRRRWTIPHGVSGHGRCRARRRPRQAAARRTSISSRPVRRSSPSGSFLPATALGGRSSSRPGSRQRSARLVALAPRGLSRAGRHRWARRRRDRVGRLQRGLAVRRRLCPERRMHAPGCGSPRTTPTWTECSAQPVRGISARRGGGSEWHTHCRLCGYQPGPRRAGRRRYRHPRHDARS